MATSLGRKYILFTARTRWVWSVGGNIRAPKDIRCKPMRDEDCMAVAKKPRFVLPRIGKSCMTLSTEFWY